MPASRRSKLLLPLCLATFGLWPALVSAQASAGTTFYKGSCDGSGAAAMSQDVFVNADDDENILSLYRIGQPEPLWSLRIDTFLDAPAKKKKPGFKEADLEGAARIGDRIYWIGSHGRDSDGDAEPARARFFATDIVDEGGALRLKTVGSRAYQGLRDALLAEPALKDLKLRDAYRPEVKKGGPAPESEAGFNIEGLAAAGDGSLLIGFRNPRLEGKALLIPLKNPAAVVEAGETPAFGPPILLPLEGRGVRSIDRLGTRYLIVASPHGTAAESGIMPPFAVYTWTGAPGDTKPVKVEGLTLPATFTPEAAVVTGDGSVVILLSDDGDIEKCKKRDAAERQFRALRIELPK